MFRAAVRARGRSLCVSDRDHREKRDYVVRGEKKNTKNPELPDGIWRCRSATRIFQREYNPVWSTGRLHVLSNPCLHRDSKPYCIIRESANSRYRATRKRKCKYGLTGELGKKLVPRVPEFFCKPNDKSLRHTASCLHTSTRAMQKRSNLASPLTFNFEGRHRSSLASTQTHTYPETASCGLSPRCIYVA